MRIILNGEGREVQELVSIEALLASLGLEEVKLAVERNRKVVARSEWASTAIENGDTLEIVTFVGGG